MIKVHDLTKVYQVPRKEYKKNIRNFFWPPTEDKIGVSNISFEINDGEIVGFVGQNGAGKTTTIKMLSGILTPSAGEVLVNGYIPSRQRKQYTHEIGVIMGQKSVLFYDIPVIESFKFYKDVYGLTTAAFEARLSLLTAKLDLKNLLNIPVRKLSLGQRMRCEIVSSLLHNPKVLFLDEPTLGLDIIAKQKILEFFKFLNNELNTTIFLTTHDLNDIDRLCKRIIILDNGSIHYDGDINKLGSRDQFRIVDIVHSYRCDLKSIFLDEIEILTSTDYRTRVKIPVCRFSTTIDRLIHHGEVNDVSINAMSLEDILRDMYTRKERTDCVNG